MLCCCCSNLLATDRQRRRKRSSSDLGINYPGDLLSQVKPKRHAVLAPPLLKRNTVAEFAMTRDYTSTASLFSGQPEQGICCLQRHFQVLVFMRPCPRGAALSVAPVLLSVCPIRASNFLEIGKL